MDFFRSTPLRAPVFDRKDTEKTASMTQTARERSRTSSHPPMAARPDRLVRLRPHPPFGRRPSLRTACGFFPHPVARPLSFLSTPLLPSDSRSGCVVTITPATFQPRPSHAEQGQKKESAPLSQDALLSDRKLSRLRLLAAGGVLRRQLLEGLNQAVRGRSIRPP